MKIKKLKTTSDIVVGQFYKALGADGYYYVGIKCGLIKRLSVVNLSPQEIPLSGFPDPLFPNDTRMLKDWEFVPCSQEEVMKNH